MLTFVEKNDTILFVITSRLINRYSFILIFSLLSI